MEKFFLLLMLIFLHGCRVGPRYDPPIVEAPPEWKQATSQSSSPPPTVEYWWQVFNDPQLDHLEFQAVESNPNLYVALERVIEARAISRAEAASLYPQINLNPEYTNSGLLFKPFIPPGLLGNQCPCPMMPASPPPKISPFRIHQLRYLLPLDFSYEVDLWGKVHDRVDSAIFDAQAEAENYCTALLTLTADVASSYFQMRGYDAEILYLEKTEAVRQKNLELTKSRYSKGLVNFLDVTQAEADLASVRANLWNARRLRILAENQLAVLVGVPPSIFHLEFNPLLSPPPSIPPGVPSTILFKRPDIARAERIMASEHALVGVAYASFFPTLNLTATLGFSSPDLSHFLRWISRYWMFGMNSSQMVYDGGRDCANLEAAYSRFMQASWSYQQQVLVAFQEVEDSLNNIEQHAKQAGYLKEAIEASQKATRISKRRYVNGVAIYLEVIENERIELQAEINFVQVLSLQYIATVQLIKALGGSWTEPSPAIPALDFEGDSFRGTFFEGDSVPLDPLPKGCALWTPFVVSWLQFT